jgi:hypothetical protein
VVEEGTAVTPVGESEVFRFYGALHAARVELAAEEAISWEPTDELVVETDSTQSLAIGCSRLGGKHVCRRDGGPFLRIRRGTEVETRFGPDTFRRPALLEVAPGEVRAIEVIFGADGARQSAHLDLGVWLLDAPEVDAPELDSERTERVLAAMANARVEGWLDVPTGTPERTVRIERAPRGGRSPVTVIDLYAGCVAHREGQPRAARIDGASCRAFAVDLVDVLAAQ